MTLHTCSRQGVTLLVGLGLMLPLMVGQGCPLLDLVPSATGGDSSTSGDEQSGGSDTSGASSVVPGPVVSFLSPSTATSAHAGASFEALFSVSSTETYTYRFFFDDNTVLDDGVLTTLDPVSAASGQIAGLVSTQGLSAGTYHLGVTVTTSSGATATAFAVGEINLVGGAFVQVLFPNGGEEASVGTLVEVRVVGRGPDDANPWIRLFYDQDNDASNGDSGEIKKIRANEGMAIWDTTSRSYGNYYVGAELYYVSPAVRDYSDGPIMLTAAGAGGTGGGGSGGGGSGGTTDREASLELTTPQYDTILLQSQVYRIRWSTNLLPGEGTVLVFREPDLDENGLPDGEASRVTIGNPGIDASVQELAFDTTGVRGKFFIGVTLTPHAGFGDPMTAYASATLTILPAVHWVGDLGTKRDENNIVQPQSGPFQGAILRGFNFQDNLGSAMMTADDYDNDGLSEIVLAAQQGKPFMHTQGGTGAGEAYMIYGSANRYQGDIEVNTTGKDKLPGVIFSGIVPNPNEPNYFVGNPLGFQVDGGPPAPFSTEGLRSLTLIPDQDNDGKKELVFGFPWCDSYSLYFQAFVDDLLPSQLLDVGRLENNGHFLRGGVVIVSSANPLLANRQALSRKSDRVIELHEVGQIFDRMQTDPLSHSAYQARENKCPAVKIDGEMDTVTWPCEGFWQDTGSVSSDGDGDNYLGSIDPLRLADPYSATTLEVTHKYWYGGGTFGGDDDESSLGSFIITTGGSADGYSCGGGNFISVNQVDPPFAPNSYHFIGGMIAHHPPGHAKYCVDYDYPSSDTVALLGTGFYGHGTSCTTRTMAEPLEPYGCRILGQTSTQLYTSPPTTANRFGHSISVSGDFLLIGAPLRTAIKSAGRGVPMLPESSRYECGEVYMLPLKPARAGADDFWWSLPGQPGDPDNPDDPGTPVVFDRDNPAPHNFIIQDVGYYRTQDCLQNIHVNGTYDRMGSPFHIVGAAPEDHIGEVTGLLDINEDGVDDFAVGGPGTNSGRGAVYVIYRRQSEVEGDYLLERLQLALNDPSRLTGLMIVGEQGENLGTAIAGSGPITLNDDYNNDTFSDLLIGSPNATPAAGFEAGQVFLMFGGRTLLNGEGGVTLAELRANGDGMLLTGADAGDRAGETVANAGDVNRDGIADILIAAPNASPPAVVRAAFDSDGDGSLDSIGIDRDGDGLPDDLDGDESPDDLTNAGVVYLVFGGKHLTGTIGLEQIGTSALPGLAFVGHKAGDRMGGGETLNGLLSRGVQRAGDIDGDGRSDLLISSILADPEGKTNAGEVYLIYGFSP